ncbi:hypothetical protein Tco_1402482 [Tanacetum coccineum]
MRCTTIASPRAEPPKTKASVKKKQAGSDKTKTPLTAKGKRLNTLAKTAKPFKKKQPAKTSKVKGLIVLSDKTSNEEDDDEVAMGSDDDDDADNQDDDDNNDDDQNDDNTDNENDGNDDDDDGQDHEGQDDDNEQTDSDNDGDDFVHPKFSTHDEEDKEEEGSDQRFQTPSHYESTDDEESDEVTHGRMLREKNWMKKRQIKRTKTTSKAEVLARSSNESKSSHVVAANLSELELKKILIDKMESNKLIYISNEQKNLYKSLVDAYKSNKLILDTYGDTVTFKRPSNVEWHNLQASDLDHFCRDDDKLYKFKEGDFNKLRIQDIEDMLLLLVQGKLTNLTIKGRLAFNNKDKNNKLMRIDELYKFSDGTLNDVRTALNDRLKGIQMKYLPQTIRRQSDRDKVGAMIQAIDKQLKTRRIMRSLEKFVGGKPYEGDFQLLHYGDIKNIPSDIFTMKMENPAGAKHQTSSW